jgi:diacylglycerol kinase (ATP)
MKPYFAIVNPAAGGGRCGKLAPNTLERLRAQGVELEVAMTRAAGDATQLARDAYSRGFRRFLAGGGDGTSYEIINGVFPQASQEPVSLGFVPLGTGNSFLRDFTANGLEHALEAIIQGRRRPSDVLRLTHRDGTLHYINLLSLGFTAEAGELTNRRFKRLGEAGYLLAILLCWMRLHFPVFPLRLDGDCEVDQRPCTYLTFSNSRYTGGHLMIAPFADVADGLIEMTRVGPIGRLDFARTFPKIFTGAHMQHPVISHQAARRVDFQLAAPVDIMIDGEVIRCHPVSIEVLPQALNVIV